MESENLETEMLVRRAKMEDLGTIQQLGFELLDFERRNWDASLDVGWPFSEAGKKKYEEAIREKFVVLAENRGEAVGYLIGKITKRDVGDARKICQAQLENIFVREGSRGVGTGAKLMSEFKEYCENEGVDRLNVSVLAQNEQAIKFYEKVGFMPRSLNLSLEMKK